MPKITECGQVLHQGMASTTIGPNKAYFESYYTRKQISFSITWMSCILGKKVFNNVFNTIMDKKDKIKDNVKAKIDIQEYCRHKDLELVERGVNC